METDQAGNPAIKDEKLREYYRTGLDALASEGDYDAVMDCIVADDNGSDLIKDETAECRKMLVWNALGKAGIGIDRLSGRQWLNIYEICTGKKI